MTCPCWQALLCLHSPCWWQTWWSWQWGCRQDPRTGGCRVEDVCSTIDDGDSASQYEKACGFPHHLWRGKGSWGRINAVVGSWQLNSQRTRVEDVCYTIHGTGAVASMKSSTNSSPTDRVARVNEFWVGRNIHDECQYLPMKQLKIATGGTVTWEDSINFELNNWKLTRKLMMCFPRGLGYHRHNWWCEEVISDNVPLELPTACPNTWRKKFKGKLWE